MKIIQNLVFSMFAFFIGVNFYQDRMDLFLHPRMQPFLFAAMLVFGLMAIVGWVQVIRDFTDQHMNLSKLRVSYLIYLVFFILLAAKPTTMSIEAIENRSVNLSVDKDTVEAIQQQTTSSPEVVTETVTETTGTGHDTRIDEDTEVEDLKNGFEVADKEEVEVVDIWSVDEDAEFEDNAEKSEYADSMRDALGMEEKTNLNPVDDFGETVMGLFNTPDDYLNRDLVLEGFIFREPHYEDDMFVISRMMITCCAADAQVVGLYVTSEQAVTLEEGQWVRVQGVVTLEEMENPYDDEPYFGYVIKDAELMMIEPYIDKYIFF